MIGIDFVDIVRPFFFIYLSQDYHPSFSAPGVAHVTDMITCHLGAGFPCRIPFYHGDHSLQSCVHDHFVRACLEDVRENVSRVFST